MNNTLHPTLESQTSNWFLYKTFIVIRFYGFTRAPYKLPAFLTQIIFSLEFIWKRLFSEEDHFGAFKKYSNVKFPLKIVPSFSKIKHHYLLLKYYWELWIF